MELLTQLAEAVVVGDRDLVVDLVEKAVAAKIPPENILKQGLIAGMDVVGDKFQVGDFFIPHMLLAARAMKTGLEALRPLLVESGVKPAGAVVLGTVQDDHHDIGKNLVAMMLEGKGFEVRDLGISVSPEKFVEAVGEDVQILGMSALLSTTAPYLSETIKALEKAGKRGRVKVMVGGGVVTPSLAKAIGADGFGADAGSAGRLALELLSGKD